MPVKGYALLQMAKYGPSSTIRRKALEFTAMTSLGSDVYLAPGLTTTPTADSEDGETLLYIGNRVAISPNVSFICSTHPEKSKLSSVYGNTKDIVVEDDVWIGADVTILGGVEIGERSVIGAGATVVDDVEPDTVVGGVPAQKIKDVEWPDGHPQSP